MQPALSDQERLLYASIAPSAETSIILKSSCRTWEDHLWADLSVLCEEKTSRELARLATANFWEGGVDNLEKPSLEVDQSQFEHQEEAWAQEVSRVLENLQSVAVAEGYDFYSHKITCIYLISVPKTICRPCFPSFAALHHYEQDRRTPKWFCTKIAERLLLVVIFRVSLSFFSHQLVIIH